MTLIFERGEAGRRATSQAPQQHADVTANPEALRRRPPAIWPELSEPQRLCQYTN